MERLLKIDESAFVGKTRKAYQLTQDRFTQLSLSLFPLASVWPTNSVEIRIFLVYAYFRNNQSAKSLANYLCHIKAGQLARGSDWLSPCQLRAVSLTVRSLERSQPNKLVHRKTAITLFIMDRMESAAGSCKHYLEFFALCRTAHDGLLRGCEFRSLTFQQLCWSRSRNRVDITIHHSKANKSGPPEVVTIRDWGSGSAVAYLCRYFYRFDLWALASSSQLIFPNFSSACSVSSQLSVLANQAGLLGDFAGHSFRSGGACDLHAANVPIESIMQTGRWKSDAVRLYLRDGEVTTIKVAQAFQFCHKHGFDFWGPNSMKGV